MNVPASRSHWCCTRWGCATSSNLQKKPLVWSVWCDQASTFSAHFLRMSRPEEWPWVNVVPWLQLNLGCARYVTCATVEWVCKAPAWSCTEWTCLRIASGRSTHSGGSWRQHISAAACVILPAEICCQTAGMPVSWGAFQHLPANSSTETATAHNWKIVSHFCCW